MANLCVDKRYVWCTLVPLDTVDCPLLSYTVWDQRMCSAHVQPSLGVGTGSVVATQRVGYGGFWCVFDSCASLSSSPSPSVSTQAAHLPKCMARCELLPAEPQRDSKTNCGVCVCTLSGLGY